MNYSSSELNRNKKESNIQIHNNFNSLNTKDNSHRDFYKTIEAKIESRLNKDNYQTHRSNPSGRLSDSNRNYTKSENVNESKYPSKANLTQTIQRSFENKIGNKFDSEYVRIQGSNDRIDRVLDKIERTDRKNSNWNNDMHYKLQKRDLASSVERTEYNDTLSREKSSVNKLNLNLLDRSDLNSSLLNKSASKKDSYSDPAAVKKHTLEFNRDYELKMKMIRDRETQANHQLELQKQSLESYKSKVEQELYNLSQESQAQLDKERCINRLKEDFEHLKQTHTHKLQSWEHTLSQKELSLHQQTQDMEYLKSDLERQAVHVAEIEKKLSSELTEKEFEIRRRESHLQDEMKQNTEMLRKIEFERNDIDSKLRIYDDFKIRENQMKVELEECERQRAQLDRSRVEQERKEEGLSKQVKDNLDMKRSYEQLLYDLNQRMEQLNQRENWISGKEVQLEEKEKQQTFLQRKLEDLEASLTIKQTELDQFNKSLAVSQANLELELKDIEDKEAKLAADLFKAQNLQDKLGNLERSMGSEKHEWKMDANRLKRELDAKAIQMQEREDDVTRKEQWLKKEEQLMQVEKDSIADSLKSLESKQNDVAKMSKDLDASKKSMNAYYEARIKELEEKLVLLNGERKKIELKTVDLDNLKMKEMQLKDYEKEIEQRHELLRKEMKNFFILKSENEKTKTYIDTKINKYKDMLKPEDNLLGDDFKDMRASNENLNQFLTGVKNVYTSNSNSSKILEKKKASFSNRLVSKESNESELQAVYANQYANDTASNQAAQNLKVHYHNHNHQDHQLNNRILDQNKTHKHTKFRNQQREMEPRLDINELSEIKPFEYNSLQESKTNPLDSLKDSKYFKKAVNSPTMFSQQLEELEKSLSKLNDKHKEDNVDKNIKLLRYYSSEGEKEVIRGDTDTERKKVKRIQDRIESIEKDRMAKSTSSLN